jgi:hypothetical protein
VHAVIYCRDRFEPHSAFLVALNNSQNRDA